MNQLNINSISEKQEQEQDSHRWGYSKLRLMANIIIHDQNLLRGAYTLLLESEYQISLIRES